MSIIFARLVSLIIGSLAGHWTWLATSPLGRMVAKYGGRWLLNLFVSTWTKIVKLIRRAKIDSENLKKLEDSLKNGTRNEQIHDAEDMLSGRHTPSPKPHAGGVQNSPKGISKGSDL